METADWVQIGVAVLSGSMLPSLGKWAWRLVNSGGARDEKRVDSLEHLVEVLRRALDKVRLREDALAQVLGVLIFGLRQVENHSPAISDAIDRAIEILETAQDRLTQINERDLA
jgi:hypothetical protein